MSEIIEIMKKVQRPHGWKVRILAKKKVRAHKCDKCKDHGVIFHSSEIIAIIDDDTEVLISELCDQCWLGYELKCLEESLDADYAENLRKFMEFRKRYGLKSGDECAVDNCEKSRCPHYLNVCADHGKCQECHGNLN